jgi:hypothetical protein
MTPKLFMVLLGCKPKGRHTEQHDVFFGIGDSLADLKPQIEAFWPDAGTIHIDGYRSVTHVNGYQIDIKANKTINKTSKKLQLFFLNLGGYKPNELEEYHYKMIEVAEEKGEAIAAAKKTAFYKHTGFKGAASHIDDKYGIDVDDVVAIEDILPKNLKKQFSITIKKASSKNITEDQLHLGYLKWSKIK